MEKKEVEMKEECCVTCGNLLTCPETAQAKCRKYVKAEPNKTDVSTKYLEVLKKVSDAITELMHVEVEMEIAEKVGIVPKEPKEKPAISKRNKEIIALIEQGKGVKEIAEELKLKPETVEKELEYLLKNEIIKTHPS